MPKELKRQEQIDKSVLKEEKRAKKLDDQKNKREEKVKIQEAKIAEKREIVILRQKMQSDLNKSRIKRDNLLSNLSKKLDKAKLNESLLKAKLKEQAIKDKKDIENEKANDRVEVSQLKKIIKGKQSDIQKDKKVIKKEIALTSIEIRNTKISNKKQNIEDKSQARIIKKEQEAKRRQQFAELKLKNKELKLDLNEKRMIQKNKNRETLIESKRLIAEEKVKISKEKEKLKFIKNEKAALAKAKRLEKIEKAKEEKFRIKEEKDKAKELHKQEVIAIKANKIRNSKNNAIEFNKEKAIVEEEVEEINGVIKADIKEIADVKAEAREKIAEPLVIEKAEVDIKDETEDFSDKYESAFVKEEKEEVQNKEQDSYIEKISGAVISSFGKKGVNKFKVAQTPSVEADIEKYKKDITSSEMIREFRKEKLEAIKVKSLAGYIEIILGTHFSKEEIDAFHAHAITALLTFHSIPFADGFISPLKNGKKTVLEFSRELEGSKTFVELKNTEVGKEVNKLITKKINAGGSILLAEGLIVVKETNGFRFLQDTNFMKA